MAACSLGASSLKIRNLNLGFSGAKLRRFQVVETKSLIGYNALVISPNKKKSLVWWRCSASEAQSSKDSDESPEKAASSDAASPLTPNSDDVEYFLTELCDTTSIAEIELKLGDFRLYVKRNLDGGITPSHPPISFPVKIEMPNSNGSVPAPSLAITRLATLLSKAADEGLVIIRSSRVGLFRRSRTFKGTRAPPSCKEKQQVKEGQVLCYIEQLGGELPVKSDVSGEVVKVLLEDGDPVGYGDPLVLILPSFPGI